MGGFILCTIYLLKQYELRQTRRLEYDKLTDQLKEIMEFKEEFLKKRDVSEQTQLTSAEPQRQIEIRSQAAVDEALIEGLADSLINNDESNEARVLSSESFNALDEVMQNSNSVSEDQKVSEKPKEVPIIQVEDSLSRVDEPEEHKEILEKDNKILNLSIEEIIALEEANVDDSAYWSCGLFREKIIFFIQENNKSSTMKRL